MPPKPKYTKEEIINAAFELAREEGIDNVVARSVGKKLNTSVTPIFTVFSSMDELKSEVVKKTRAVFLEYMHDVLDYTPAFKEYGMRWVHFALKEPQLYRILFMNTYDEKRLYDFYFDELGAVLNPLLDEICGVFGINREDAESLLNQMTIHANGIAAFCVNDQMTFTDEYISSSISSVCIGLVLMLKVKDGSFNPAIAKSMAETAGKGILPVRKSPVNR